MNKQVIYNMMQTIPLSGGQCFLDVAAQYLGDVERVFEICLANEYGLTDEVEPETMLIVAEAKFEKRRVIAELIARNHYPASKEDVNDVDVNGGIGYMQIGNNFKVS